MTPTIIHIDDLVADCKKGNQRAQMEIYNRYYKAMYNTALRIVNDTAEAEDVMQEAFINAFTKIESYKGVSPFGAWLKKIVINKSLSAYNRKVKKAEVSYNDELKNEIDDSEGIIISEEHINSKVQHILKVLNTLKTNYSLILKLHLIEGYDYDEICEILNITPAACRTTISRAKESLRSKLVSYEN